MASTTVSSCAIVILYRSTIQVLRISGGSIVINNQGVIVGAYADADGDEHGFLALSKNNH